MSTPVGTMKIVGSEAYVHAVGFPSKRADDEGPNEMTRRCAQQLEEYFEGSRQVFDIPLQAQGSEFQVLLWEELMKIPFAARTTYVELAQRLGDANYTRAVGLANAKNPVAVIIPCHRVVGRDGKLTGYAGGVWRKKWLLKHEQMIAGVTRQLELFE